MHTRMMASELGGLCPVDWSLGFWMVYGCWMVGICFWPQSNSHSLRVSDDGRKSNSAKVCVVAVYGRGSPVVSPGFLCDL